jgi:hypothetical protein
MGFRRVPEVNLDMDSVLFDFATPAAKILGRPVSMDITKEDWLIIERDERFWLNLELMPDGLKLWEETFATNPYILTAPGGSDQDAKFRCVFLKQQCCIRNLPGFSIQQFRHCRGVEKQQYAKDENGNPNILIDDYHKNVDQWNAAGGRAILHTDTESSLEQFRILYPTLIL